MKKYKISHNTKQFKAYLEQEQIPFEISENLSWIIIECYCDTDVFDLGMAFERWLRNPINLIL